MTGAIMWALGLAIGALFGWFWGYAAGQRSVVIALPTDSTGLSGSGGQTDSN